MVAVLLALGCVGGLLFLMLVGLVLFVQDADWPWRD